ncbi:MAG: hypothetical protein IMZ54_02825 [Acidobacteria bacterium]|nr:hypothetical protein [Acidobacteriota bacterium]MBE3129638.1 hypothetical protein [Acidobacteriota bacterium]
MNEPEKNRIVGVISDLLSERVEIVFAYVFGSFVGDANFSDIDIGVFVQGIPQPASLNLELQLERQVESLVHVPADVRILNGAPPSFIFQIIKRSRRVVDKDPNLRAEFEGRILKEYFDFAPFRRRYLEEVGHAPLRS